jgi:hypothetical protein
MQGHHGKEVSIYQLAQPKELIAHKVEDSPWKPSADMLCNAQVALPVHWYKVNI